MPGRVELDSRGNSVWRWDDEQGESTTSLVKRLENDELELEPTRPARAAGGRSEGRSAASSGGADEAPGLDDKVGGFDPYNRS
jgi:hypothetical protein